MSANDDSVVCLAGNSRDDRVLLPGVGEALGVDVLSCTGVLDYRVDLFQDPV